MTALLISPIKIKTRGGLEGEINGIDPIGSDNLCGQVIFPNAGSFEVAWDDVGTCRNQPSDCNIDVSHPDLYEVLETA